VAGRSLVERLVFLVCDICCCGSWRFLDEPGRVLEVISLIFFESTPRFVSNDDSFNARILLLFACVLSLSPPFDVSVSSL